MSRADQASSGLGPVGDPIGGQTFSAWQPGIITGANTGSTLITDLYFSASISAWSPDGRFVAPSVLVTYSLSASGPSLQPHPKGIATAAYRDAAMRAVGVNLKAVHDPNFTNIPLAWRPDGQRLAALVPNSAFSGAYTLGAVPGQAEQVAIYDCVTGRELKRLSTAPVTTAPTTPFSPAALVARWPLSAAAGHRVCHADALGSRCAAKLKHIAAL
ncbi:MAG: hypothetical protein IVW57_15405 [Ktedonobacterales bacterium]|nr:hypothetical protein [Ktedonobacterales bacterium]